MGEEILLKTCNQTKHISIILDMRRKLLHILTIMDKSQPHAFKKHHNDVNHYIQSRRHDLNAYGSLMNIKFQGYAMPNI